MGLGATVSDLRGLCPSPGHRGARGYRGAQRLDVPLPSPTNRVLLVLLSSVHHNSVKCGLVIEATGDEWPEFSLNLSESGTVEVYTHA